MKAANVLPIVDIDSKEITSFALEQFKGNETYQDQVLNEHIYNIDSLLEHFDELEEMGGVLPFSLEFLTEVKSIKALCEENETCYFRIIFW